MPAKANGLFTSAENFEPGPSVRPPVLSKPGPAAPGARTPPLPTVTGPPTAPVPPRLAPAPTVTALAASVDPLTSSVPPVTAVGPVYELALLRVRVPAPALVREVPAPWMAPAMLAGPASLTVRAANGLMRPT